jgi:hypothetical protein
MKATWLLALALVGGSARAASVEDDLAVVKKAVAHRSPDQAGMQAPSGSPGPWDPAAKPATPSQEQEKDPPRVRARTGKEPQWLRVRVVEKAGKKVSVNLPLALVRALGDDIPIGLHCGRYGKGSTLTIGEVLRVLDSGQDLVQVDDEDANVRVWVE